MTTEWVKARKESVASTAERVKATVRREATLLYSELNWQMNEIDPSGYIQSVQEILRTSPDVSLFLYANHLCDTDFIAMLNLYYKKFNRSGKRRLVVPGSQWSYDNDPRFRKGYEKVRGLFGFESSQIIQGYMVEGLAADPGKVRYTQAQYLESVRRLLLQLKATNGDLLLFPEGHRSDTGLTGRLEEGIGNLAGKRHPCVLLPVGLRYSGVFERSGINPGIQVNKVIGEPIVVSDRRGAAHSQIVHNLLQCLPREKWGIYAS